MPITLINFNSDLLTFLPHFVVLQHHHCADYNIFLYNGTNYIVRDDATIILHCQSIKTWKHLLCYTVKTTLHQNTLVLSVHININTFVGKNEIKQPIF